MMGVSLAMPWWSPYLFCVMAFQGAHNPPF